MRYLQYLKAKKIYNADQDRERYGEKLLKSHERPIPQHIPTNVDSPSTRGITTVSEDGL